MGFIKCTRCGSSDCNVIHWTMVRIGRKLWSKHAVSRDDADRELAISKTMCDLRWMKRTGRKRVKPQRSRRRAAHLPAG
jgi:hypothetical protein